jgi:hypothetical protein
MPTARHSSVLRKLPKYSLKTYQRPSIYSTACGPAERLSLQSSSIRASYLYSDTKNALYMEKKLVAIQR